MKTIYNIKLYNFGIAEVVPTHRIKTCQLYRTVNLEGMEEETDTKKIKFAWSLRG